MKQVFWNFSTSQFPSYLLKISMISFSKIMEYRNHNITLINIHDIIMQIFKFRKNTNLSVDKIGYLVDQFAFREIEHKIAIEA